MSTFQRLYDSEINFSISCFWDSGFEVKLGDDLNGFAAETRVASWDEIEPWLRMQGAPLSRKQFPRKRIAGARGRPEEPNSLLA